MASPSQTRKTRQRVPPEFFAPTDVQEFKFCFALMDAAGSGRMVTRNPQNSKVLLDDGGETIEIAFNDTPMNRAMMAAVEHYRLAHPRKSAGTPDPEYHALMNRLMCFTDFIRDCLHGKHKRAWKFFQDQNGALVGIDEALIEAAATAKLGVRGFNARVLCQAAERLPKSAA